MRHKVLSRFQTVSGHAIPLQQNSGAQPQRLDENVQFTVYRPAGVQVGRWYPLLAFAHLSERRPEAAPEEPDPVQEVKRQAAAVLADEVGRYRQVTEDSARAVPREGELTFVPVIAGIEFNPPQRTFLWQESVHREEFRMRAGPSLEGQVARGRLTVFLGSIIVGDLALSVRVGGGEPLRQVSATTRVYRKIFASYSHQDVAIVEECVRFARAVGDEYLRDIVHLRTGEVWDERLRQMIEDADVFQLFWSRNSLHSRFVRQEWEHALSLSHKGPGFIRPVYWEDPLPTDPVRGMPPDELRRLHFQRLGTWSPETRSQAKIADLGQQLKAVVREVEEGIGSADQLRRSETRLARVVEEIAQFRQGHRQLSEEARSNITNLEQNAEFTDLRRQLYAVLGDAEQGIQSADHLRRMEGGLRRVVEGTEQFRRKHQLSHEMRSEVTRLEDATTQKLRRLREIRDDVEDAEILNPLVARFNSLTSSVQGGVGSRDVRDGVPSLELDLRNCRDRLRTPEARKRWDELRRAMDGFQSLGRNVKWAETAGIVTLLLALSVVFSMTAVSWWLRIPWGPLATVVRWVAWILTGLSVVGILGTLLRVVSRGRAAPEATRRD
jgi:hypothetical protein